MKNFILTLLLLSFFSGTSIYGQFTRKVLFEEATNASCAPCAQNNPILKAFLDANANVIVAIKYHSSWPGVDPMYSHNPTQNTERIVNYYSINAVPWLNVDGIIQDVWPFTQQNFQNALNTRLAIQSPLQITVIDQRIAGDSIRATININIPSNLPSGDYKLRVMAIEGRIQYQSPPGTNGETVFEHVFRRAFPNTTGTTISTTAGNYQYIFTYKRDPVWVDTSLYTIAFIQNDVNKEVLNCAKPILTGISPVNNESASEYSLSQNYPNPFNPSTKIRFSIPADGKGLTTDVKLIVFDILGRELTTLVNEQLIPGYYEVLWDASEYPSGIYFYQLLTDGYTETRKMSLIR